MTWRGFAPPSPTLAENPCVVQVPSEDMHSPLVCGPRFLLQSHSLPWLLSWSDGFSFSNFPNPHGLHITKQGREVDRLSITIHKCFAGKWINEATWKFWRSFRYLTLRPALGLYPPPTWFEALTQPSSRGGWNDLQPPQDWAQEEVWCWAEPGVEGMKQLKCTKERGQKKGNRERAQRGEMTLLSLLTRGTYHTASVNVDTQSWC